MKKIVLTLMVALLATFAFAQNDTGETELTNGPVITFEEKVHDFGDQIPKGSQDVECEFVFTNTGNEPLILSNVRANCGCTTPSWSREPILPGKQGAIKAKYTTTHRVSKFRKQITVSSNATNGAQILTIQGTIVNEPPSGVIKDDEGAPKANK